MLHVWLEMNHYFRTLGVSLKCNCLDREIAGSGEKLLPLGNMHPSPEQTSCAHSTLANGEAS